MPDPTDDIGEAFGMNHTSSTKDDGTVHHTVYNDVTRISWDDDGKKVTGYHERRAPGTSGGGIKGGRKP